MTDKEVKRLTRSQLIEIIYQLQLKQEELMAENERLAKALEDKRILLDKAGNIARAALELHNVMQSAQDAADHYLQEMQTRADEVLSKAMAQAAEIVAHAEKNISGTELD